jgi:hypothetical protein
MFVEVVVGGKVGMALSVGVIISWLKADCVSFCVRGVGSNVD